MYIRKRISPSRRQTPSYQILETYREFMTGKVKQRVLINLGSCADLQRRLRRRGSSGGSKGRPAVPSKALADRIRALERLISRWPRRLSPETTGAVRPMKPRSNDYDWIAARRVRERRIALGLTLQEMAARAGVSYQGAHKYETGINRMSVGRLVTSRDRARHHGKRAIGGDRAGRAAHPAGWAKAFGSKALSRR